MKEKKMKDAALDEIGVGSIVHMKEDMTTTPYDIMNDEDAEERNGKWQWHKMLWRRDAQSSQTCTLFTNIHPNMHNNAQGQCLKLQKTFSKTFNIVCHQHHPTSLPPMLNESQ